MQNSFKEIIKKTPLFGPIKKVRTNLSNLKFSLVRRLKPHSIILLYHRVANVNSDPQLLCVSPTNFEQQIYCLKIKYKFISLSELGHQIKTGRVERNTLVITFDDGYLDNLTDALPILTKYKVPATIFVTAGKIDDKKPFDWDNGTPVSDRGAALNQQELIALASSPLIEIGAHTMTHPHLSALSAQDQRLEIEQSKKKIQSILGKEVSAFAYPFGTQADFTIETEEIVRSAGFKVACANFFGITTNSSDVFKLPRLLIRNWSADELIAKTNL